MVIPDRPLCNKKCSRSFKYIENNKGERFSPTKKMADFGGHESVSKIYLLILMFRFCLS